MNSPPLTAGLAEPSAKYGLQLLTPRSFPGHAESAYYVAVTKNILPVGGGDRGRRPELMSILSIYPVVPVSHRRQAAQQRRLPRSGRPATAPFWSPTCRSSASRAPISMRGLLDVLRVERRRDRQDVHRPRARAASPARASLRGRRQSRPRARGEGRGGALSPFFVRRSRLACLRATATLAAPGPSAPRAAARGSASCELWCSSKAPGVVAGSKRVTSRRARSPRWSGITAAPIPAPT